MAKIPAGILGRISGKVGDVVGASWKGIPYIRQYVIPANPNTASQQIERGFFRDLVSMAKAALGPVLQVFWDPFLRAVSGWAHFIGVNRYLYETTGDYSAVLLCRGTLENTPITTATYATDTVVFAWSATCMGNGLPGDAACLFVYDKTNKVGFFNGTALRSQATGTVIVGAGRTVTDLECWLFFADSYTAPTVVSFSDQMTASAA